MSEAYPYIEHNPFMEEPMGSPKDEALRIWWGVGASYGWRVYLDGDGQPFAVYTANSPRCTAKYGYWRRHEISEMPLHAQKAFAKSALAQYLAAQKEIP